MSEVLEAIEMQTAANPQHCVIWMHGLGADGHDFAPIVPELGLPRAAAVRFIFPHAPMQPVTVNNGYVMRAWYDILEPDLVRREDERGLRASQAQIETLVARETSRGIKASNLVLAGFSQGGAIAFQTGLRHAARVPRTAPERRASALEARVGSPDPDRARRGMPHPPLDLARYPERSPCG